MRKAFSEFKTWQIAALVLGAVSLLASGAWLTQATAEPADREAINYAKGLSRAFRAAANAVLPAVVTIIKQPAVVAERRPQGGSVNPFEGTPFEDLFRDDPRMRRFFRSPRAQPSIGSGVIIDPSGLILTNSHVVDGGGEVTVRLHDGREFIAEDVKTDPRTDVAIVRISGARDLTAARIGDSDVLEVGDWVLAVGNPFGQEGSVTAGIISAKNRGPGIINHRTGREEFLQTDAAINPGNSGGPLINLDGEVVGINTAISTRTGSYMGVAFAIPANLATWVADELAQFGEVRRAYLGVGIQPIDNDLARQFGLEARRGALITTVGPDTPASEAGLQSGDVVVEFAGKEVVDNRSLQAIVERTPIDSEQSLEIIRDGKRQQLRVIVRKWPKNYGMEEQPSLRSAPAPTPKTGSYNDLGIEVAPLDDEVAQQLGIEDALGVVITSVKRGSQADREGLRSTMVITKVGQKTVTNLEEFEQAMKEVDFENEGVLFLIRSGSGSRFVVIPAPRK